MLLNKAIKSFFQQTFILVVLYFTFHVFIITLVLVLRLLLLRLAVRIIRDFNLTRLSLFLGLSVLLCLVLLRAD